MHYFHPACPEGKWGAGCMHDCPCLHEGKCAPLTGKCTCHAGWIGQYCGEKCAEGKYGMVSRGICPVLFSIFFFIKYFGDASTKYPVLLILICSSFVKKTYIFLLNKFRNLIFFILILNSYYLVVVSMIQVFSISQSISSSILSL